MRYAILITTLTSPQQMKKLVGRFDGSLFDIYIHISKRTSSAAYDDILAQKNVFLIDDRISTNAGGYSKVKAAIAGIHQILGSETAYVNITLLNGRDYPIKTAGQIVAYYKANEGKQFIKYSEGWFKTNSSNFNQHHLIDHNSVISPIIAKLMNMIWGRPKLPKNLRILGGSPHWAITPDCARYTIEYIERFEFERSLKYIKNSEKFLFQSVIMNSSFKNSVVNDDLRYMEGPAEGKRTKLLKAKDLGKLMASDKLFAGRFDIREDEKVLDMINEAVDAHS